MSWSASAFPMKPLGELARIQAGYAFESARFTESPTDVPLVKGENVQQGYVDWSIAKRWPEAEMDALKQFLLKPGDIVVAMDRPWVEAGLKWAYIKPEDPPSLLVQRVARLRAGCELDQTYLRAVISSSYFSAYIQPIVTGVNVPHISGKQIAGFKVPVPPLEQQSKVAALISAYDDLIANNQRRISLLESMAGEIYREWFVRMRFPKYESVKKAKGIPEGWTPTTLGQIASFVMGQSPSSEHYNETGDGLPFHQGVGTYGNRFPRHKVYCSSAGRKANAGDILFSVRAPVGRLNVADRELIIGRGLASMRHKQDLNSYLFYLLKATFANEDMIGNGSIFNSVGKDELAKQPILRPPSELTRMFETLVRPIDDQLATLHSMSTELRAQRDALLPRLISGKLRVDSLDIHFPPSMRSPTAKAAQRVARSR